PFALPLALLSMYALFATGSRAPAIAVVVAYAIGLFALATTRTSRGRVMGAAVFTVIALIFMAGSGLPLFAQTSLGQRFLQTSGDAKIRLEHWQQALEMQSDTILSEFFGKGVGTFPRLYQQSVPSRLRLARYEFVADGDNKFL